MIFFIFSNDEKEIVFLKKHLNSHFDVKDLGIIKQCLGMQVFIDKSNNTIKLSQELYIDQLLEKFNMSECKPVKTPIESKLDFSVESKEIDVPYQQLIGSLMYLAVLTRPDIAYSVSFLSQFNNCFLESHWKCAKRILRYLAGTKSYGLLFSKGDMTIQGFVDADWAGNFLDRKSYTGYMFKMNGAAISYESVKQKIVAMSSMEAEYMAMSEASKEAIYLKGLLSELTGKNECIQLFNDNKSALYLTANATYHKRSKHIDVRHHFVRDAILNNQIKASYLNTGEMPADILTKGLSVEKHYKHLKGFGMYP